MKIRAFFFVRFGSQTSALDLDANRSDRHAFGLKVCLQSGHKLAQFGCNRIGAGQQTPLPLVDRSSLHTGAQRRGQQALDGLHAVG